MRLLLYFLIIFMNIAHDHSSLLFFCQLTSYDFYVTGSTKQIAGYTCSVRKDHFVSQFTINNFILMVPAGRLREDPFTGAMCTNNNKIFLLSN